MKKLYPFFVTQFPAIYPEREKVSVLTNMQEPDGQAGPPDTLDDILYTLQSQKFEPGGYFTIGGTAGTYQLKSPWNTECEYTLLSVSTSAASGASFAFSSSNPYIQAPTITTQYGLLSQGTEGSNPYEGIAGFATVSSQNVYAGIWVPLGRGAIIYLNVAPTASNVVYATIAFRRSYMHLQPTGDSVRQLPPATHTRPVSRRNIRMLDNLSKQMSGYAAQYPERTPGGKEGYTHEEIPWTQDPRSSLTSIRGQGRNRYGK